MSTTERDSLPNKSTAATSSVSDRRAGGDSGGSTVAEQAEARQPKPALEAVIDNDSHSTSNTPSLEDAASESSSKAATMVSKSKPRATDTTSDSGQDEWSDDNRLGAETVKQTKNGQHLLTAHSEWRKKGPLHHLQKRQNPKRAQAIDRRIVYLCECPTCLSMEPLKAMFFSFHIPENMNEAEVRRDICDDHGFLKSDLSETMIAKYRLFCNGGLGKSKQRIHARQHFKFEAELDHSKLPRTFCLPGKKCHERYLCLKPRITEKTEKTTEFTEVESGSLQETTAASLSHEATEQSSPPAGASDAAAPSFLEKSNAAKKAPETESIVSIQPSHITDSSSKKTTSDRPATDSSTTPPPPDETADALPATNSFPSYTTASSAESSSAFKSANPVEEAKRRYPTEPTETLEDRFYLPNNNKSLHPGNVLYRKMIHQLAHAFDPSSEGNLDIIAEHLAQSGCVCVSVETTRKTTRYIPYSWEESIDRILKSVLNRRASKQFKLEKKETLLQQMNSQSANEDDKDEASVSSEIAKPRKTRTSATTTPDVATPCKDNTRNKKRRDDDAEAHDEDPVEGIETTNNDSTNGETMEDTVADTMGDTVAADDDNGNDDMDREKSRHGKKRKKKSRGKLNSKSKKTKLITEPISMPDGEGLKVGDRIGVYWVDPHNVYYAGRIAELGTATNPPRKLFYIHYDDTTFEWMDLSSQKFIRMPVAQFPARSYCVPDVHRIVAKYNLYDTLDDTIHNIPEPEELVKDGWGDDLSFETLFWHIKGKSVLKAARTLQYKLSTCLQDEDGSAPALPSFASESVLKSLENHKINRSAVRSTLMVLGMILECDHAIDFSEAITMVSSSMKIHQDDKPIQFYGIMCLFNLLGKKGEGASDSIVASGSINATIRAMERFDSCEDIQQTSCWFLREASQMDAGVAQNIASEKGLTAIVQTVERFTGQVKEDAALALMCVTQGMVNKEKTTSN